MPPRRRLLVLAAAIGAGFGAFALGVPHSPEEIRTAVDRLGPLAPLLFALCWAALTPALASGPLLAGAAGLAFGIALGTAVGIVGATLGGVLAFAIARRYGHGAAQDLCGPRLRRIQERVERRGFAAVLCARAAPGMPTTLLNYACGLSRVRLRDFAAGSLLGGAPRILAYAAMGSSGGRLDSPAALVGLGLIAVMGLGASGAVLLGRLRPAAV